MAGSSGSRSLYDFTLVGGTWSFDGEDRHEWWQYDSAFAAFLKAHGLNPSHPVPFIWSSDIDGGFRWPWTKRKFRDWESAGYALAYYLDDVPPERRLVIAHSHGGQVALFAASQGTRIAQLVTVGTPVRRDMREVRALARPNIKHWLHVHVKADRMQRLGELFDGHLGIHREFEEADVNAHVDDRKVGHSGVLTRAEYFRLWIANGWLDYFVED